MSKLIIYLIALLFSLAITVNSTLPVECELQPLPGPCRGFFPSFFFNPSTKQCESFTYGGCKGNANRFDSKENCLAYCGESRMTDEA